MQFLKLFIAGTVTILLYPEKRKGKGTVAVQKDKR